MVLAAQQLRGNEMKICQHCGGQHEGECGVREATQRILENYVPRGMTAGEPCPGCHYDGVWHWHNKSTEFKCERCGTIVPSSHGR